MVEQETTSAGLTTFENGIKRDRSTRWYRTEEARRNISEGLRRKAREKREGMDVSGEWRRLLLLRDASPQTIAELSDSPDDEDEKNKKSIDFARELLRKGLISDDTTSWRSLVLHYSKNKRKLASFFDMLRLEVFHKGIQEARRGDLTLLNLYRDTGYMIDSGFDTNLADEEDYVAGLIDEKPAGTDEDEYGLYREDIDGRWREPVSSGESGSGIIFNSSRHSVLREIIKNYEPPKS